LRVKKVDLTYLLRRLECSPESLEMICLPWLIVVLINKVATGFWIGLF
jgi:hypothetical protein